MQAINFPDRRKEMNKFRGLVPSLVLGLAISFAGIAAAQTVAQSGTDKKADSCCCCSDSCPMMKDGAMKSHASSTDKHEACCGGDSCSMMKKDGAMKNH